MHTCTVVGTWATACVPHGRSCPTINQMCKRSSRCRITQCFTAWYGPLLPLLSRWYTVLHHKVLIPVDCLGIFRLVHLYVHHRHTHTHSNPSSSFFFTLTHTYADSHSHTLRGFYSLWIIFFLWLVSTGIPWDQSWAVDLPYHKTSVSPSKIAGALLEIFIVQQKSSPHRFSRFSLKYC